MEPPIRYFINAYGIEAGTITSVDQTLPRLNFLLTENGYPSYTSANKQFHLKETKISHGVTAVYLLDDKRDGFIRRPGHLTIHTWPEYNRFSADIVLAREDDCLAKKVENVFPGDYRIIKEYAGRADGLPPAGKPIGREVVDYLSGLQNCPEFRERDICQILSEVAKEARFTKVGEVRRETEEYLSGAIILSTSHFSLHYDKKEGQAWADVFTCTEGGKDEGDPDLGMAILTERLCPERGLSSYRLFLRR